MTTLEDLEARLARLEATYRPGLLRRIWNWYTNLSNEALMFGIIVMLLGVILWLAWTGMPHAAGSGVYVHRTSDAAYVDGQGALVQDPYGVGEGAGARNVGNHVVYVGPLPDDTWQQAEADGWPYDRTRALLAVRFPPGVPGRFHFDHDAAAQLLAQGLTLAGLDRVYAMGDTWPSLPRSHHD